MPAERVPYRITYLDDPMRARALETLERGLPSYGGEETEHFEVELAEACGARFGVTSNSGTSALLLILMAAGVGPGDEVVLGANDYIGCLSAIAAVGATPVFVDTELDTANIDATSVEAVLTDKSRAIIATHLYGHPCDLDGLRRIADTHDLLLVEDLAHALGARHRDRPVGGIGDAGFCSFSGKHITVFGPGGVAVTNDERMAEAMSSLRDQGRNRERHVSFIRRTDESWYDQERIGLNLHLSETSAALGRLQLALAPDWGKHRREAAAYLDGRLDGNGPNLRLPPGKSYAQHAYLHYTIMTPQRDALRDTLLAAGFETQVHYPKPLHALRPVAERWPQTHAFPTAERVADEVLSLPVGPHMDGPRLERMADTVVRFFEERVS